MSIVVNVLRASAVLVVLRDLMEVFYTVQNPRQAVYPICLHLQVAMFYYYLD
ncbi:hypothetical protein KC19_2G121200 [Ceratodon purpureus]|uniref:Uncharacterized protein n=1 Tax=Ceratodon purpureus TaxID=3225 RepID=A0A8T0IUQ9_CERPU|nr:hypothetical protein KC19_2G121200 [Ceratodon purpureus]